MSIEGWKIQKLNKNKGCNNREGGIRDIFMFILSIFVGNSLNILKFELKANLF